jgi:hypothetical protein
VEGDVPIDSEALVVTSSISRPDGSVFWTLFLKNGHRGKVWMRVFIAINVYTYVLSSTSIIICLKKNKENQSRLKRSPVDTQESGPREATTRSSSDS